MGVKHLNDRDFGRALKYWTNAAKLGDAMVHNDIKFVSG